MTNVDFTALAGDIAELAQNTATTDDRVCTLRGRTMEMFRNTPGGNAERFIARHSDAFLCDVSGRRVRFFVPNPLGLWEEAVRGEVTRMGGQLLKEMRDRGKLLADTGQTDDEKSIGKRLVDYSGKCDNRTAIRDMAAHAAEEFQRTVVAEEQFNQLPNVLAMSDGRLIELREDGIRIRSIERSDMLTYTARGVYRPELLETPPDEVKMYLTTFMPNDAFRFRFFKVLGQALYGNNAARLLILVLGKTTCGKSQLMEAMRAALGEYSKTGTASVLRGNFDDKPRPDILRLIYRRHVYLNEADEAWELHGGHVKDVTGGGDIPVRGMNTNEFTDIAPHFTPIMIANTMPTVKNADAALKRRMLAFNFTHRFTGEEDPNIKERFIASQDVADWIVTSLIDGYVRARAEGIQDVIDAQSLETMEAFSGLTHLGQFIEWLADDDTLEIIPRDVNVPHHEFVQMRPLHEMYEHWIKVHGTSETRRDKLTYRKFNEQLENSGWEKHKCNSSTHWVGRRLRERSLAELERQLR